MATCISSFTKKKQEVYVMLRAAMEAWPDGRGRIRLGFSHAKRRQYPDDNAFRSAFLAAVQEYEAVRRRIDVIFDEYRKQEGYGENDPVPAVLLRRWQGRLPPELAASEQRRRREMEQFTELRTLMPGKQCGYPGRCPMLCSTAYGWWSFRTPVYERRIISFGQKVLTRGGGWDTPRSGALHGSGGAAGAAAAAGESPGGAGRMHCRFRRFSRPAHLS